MTDTQDNTTNNNHVPFSLIKAVLTSPYTPGLSGGGETHEAALGFVNSVLPHTGDEDRILQLVAAILPEDYSGDTLKEVPEMVRSGIKKGLHEKGKKKGEKKGKPAISGDCIAIAKDEGIDFFHDKEGEAYGTIRHKGGGAISYNINSRYFKDYLSLLYYRKAREPLPDSELREALAVLRAQARFDNPEHPVFLRRGRVGDHVFIDLGREDYKFLKIGPDGRTVETECGAKFYRPAGFLELPFPEEGGDLLEFKKLLGLSDKNFILLLAFIISALNPDGPYFSMILSAGQGAGKSVLCTLTKRIFDPMVANKMRLPNSERDLMIQGASNALLVYDNVSAVKWDMSDALCSLSTGSGYSTRKLYANNELQVFAFARPYILNGIGEFASRPDFLDRTIPVYLPSIQEGKRKPEREINADFEKMLPGLLGCLYDIVGHALKHWDKVVAPTEIRMADAAQWLAAAEGACGFLDGTFVKAIQQAQQDMSINNMLDNALAMSLRGLLVGTDDGIFEGTIGTLYRVLIAQDGDFRSVLPKNPSGLSKELARIGGTLSQVGINLEQLKRSKDGKRVKIWIREGWVPPEF